MNERVLIYELNMAMKDGSIQRLYFNDEIYAYKFRDGLEEDGLLIGDINSYYLLKEEAENQLDKTFRFIMRY